MRTRRQSLYIRLSVAARSKCLLTRCNSFAMKVRIFPGSCGGWPAKSPQGEFSGSETWESGEERAGWAGTGTGTGTGWGLDWKESGSGTGSALALALFERKPQTQQLSRHKSSIRTFLSERDRNVYKPPADESDRSCPAHV
jgi:hypothetical protein